MSRVWCGFGCAGALPGFQSPRVPARGVAGGAAALLLHGNSCSSDTACVLQKPAVLLRATLSAGWAGREPRPLVSTAQKISLKGGSPCCAVGAGDRPPKGLNGPTLQLLPEPASGSSLRCPLCSGSRAEVALVPQSAGSPMKPQRLHGPHGSQVGFGGFSLKRGHWWWDGHLCLGLTGYSLPSVLPSDPFQPLPSPNHSPAVPMQHQWSRRLSDLPKAMRDIRGGERRAFCVGGRGHPGGPWPVLSHSCSLDVHVPSC